MYQVADVQLSPNIRKPLLVPMCPKDQTSMDVLQYDDGGISEPFLYCPDCRTRYQGVRILTGIWRVEVIGEIDLDVKLAEGGVYNG